METRLLTMRLKDVARMCLITALVTITLLWPPDYLWWRALGVIG